MSLNWDISKITDWENVCFEEGTKIQSLVTYALIHYTMIVGINEITEDNYREFHKRMSFCDLVEGRTLIYTAENDVSIPLNKVKDHIGLNTNASEKTNIEFAAEKFDSFYREN
jgi:hypothetical protein